MKLYHVLAALCIATACTTNSQQPSSASDNTATYDSIAEGVSVLKSVTDDCQLFWLKDNEGDKLNSPDLFADAPEALIDSLGLSAGIPASVSTFVLKQKHGYALFDAGLGPKMGGHLVERLASIGLTPDSIQIIFLTHLHLDHIGGLMSEEGPVFENAEVYLSSAEYDAWINDMPSDKNGMQVAMTTMYDQHLRLFDFGDTLSCGVVAIDAVGHTPGHTAFQKGDLLVIGDLMHGLALQSEHPEYNSNYDMDKEKSIESRKRVLQYARENGLQMAGMHLPAPGFTK